MRQSTIASRLKTLGTNTCNVFIKSLADLFWFIAEKVRAFNEKHGG